MGPCAREGARSHLSILLWSLRLRPDRWARRDRYDVSDVGGSLTPSSKPSSGAGPMSFHTRDSALGGSRLHQSEFKSFILLNQLFIRF